MFQHAFAGRAQKARCQGPGPHDRKPMRNPNSNETCVLLLFLPPKNVPNTHAQAFPVWFLRLFCPSLAHNQHTDLGPLKVRATGQYRQCVAENCVQGPQASDELAGKSGNTSRESSIKRNLPRRKLLEWLNKCTNEPGNCARFKLFGTTRSRGLIEKTESQVVSEEDPDTSVMSGQPCSTEVMSNRGSAKVLTIGLGIVDFEQRSGMMTAFPNLPA